MATHFDITRSPKPTSEKELEKILDKPGFGDYFTDHMVSIDFSGQPQDGSWKNPKIEPYGLITLDPATAVLHYGQEIFEGLKAFRFPDKSVRVFRPEKNAQRFNRSALRMQLPRLPEEMFLDSIKELLRIDQAWVPSGEGDALYIRPFMYASEKFIGVRPAREVAFKVIACPAGNYFGEVKPLKIWLSEEYARAGVGGTGTAKCGGNYAASMIAQSQAEENGCAQVVFRNMNTDAIEELGGMNIFFVFSDGTVATPALNGTILEGITRDSVIELLKDQGYSVEERDITVSEWKEGVENGKISEVFACGTAASIAPIGQLVTEQGSYGNVDQPPGELTMKLRDQIIGIQTGQCEDTYGWMTSIT